MGKYKRCKWLEPIHIKYFLFVEAEFVNPKLLTDVPGPGNYNPKDIYTTKEKSSTNWSINRIDKNGKPRG